MTTYQFLWVKQVLCTSHQDCEEAPLHIDQQRRDESRTGEALSQLAMKVAGELRVLFEIKHGKHEQQRKIQMPLRNDQSSCRSRRGRSRSIAWNVQLLLTFSVVADARSLLEGLAL